MTRVRLMLDPVKAVFLTGPLAANAEVVEDKLEIGIINRWSNRLIAEASLPPEKRLTMTSRRFDPKAPLLDSGLLGPVTVQTAQ